MQKLVTDYLEKAALMDPEKIAFVESDHSITYAQVKEKSLSIAKMIVDMGCFKKPVAILMDKGLKTIISFLGVAFSGNFYTVIDTKMPEMRILKILDVLKPEVVLADKKHEDLAYKIAMGVNVLLYENALNGIANSDEILALRSKILASDILYVLFTSGSTGIPKGVVTSHRAVVSYLEALTEAYHIDEKTIIGNQVPFYFVMSIVDIYGTIAKRATMHIIPQKYFAFPDDLVRYIHKNKINTVSWVPSALCLIANRNGFKAADITCLKTIIFGGEAMPIKYLKAWQKAVPDATYINGYGPTEITDGCTYYIVDREFHDNEVLPIGVPFSNSEILVIDENDQIVKKGTGELCVRSDSMTYGYYGDFDKTNEVFRQNPANPHYKEIIYKTGDLVKYNQYGELEYVGRMDSQIKHMGRRIELGEIESSISSIDTVKEGCCLYDSENQKIVLFYQGDIEESVLGETLKKLLPAYMRPQIRIRLSIMPRNLNGKIDREMLKGRLENIQSLIGG